MKNYAEAEVFAPDELVLLRRATALVAAIPDVHAFGELRCHELARAVGRALDLQVQDGRYFLVEHSWLSISPRQRGQWRENILDVYCVGSLPQVQIRACVPGESHVGTTHVGYRPGPAREDIREAVVDGLVEIFRREAASGR
ncbi:MAG: hypothetical protein ACHREM_04705 [Polyangiales bacterium]